MKIAFALAVHAPNDERVWHQQALALKKSGHDVYVVSARKKQFNPHDDLSFDNSNLKRKETINNIIIGLQKISPDVIICDNPISILSASKYKKKTKKNLQIYYDITEWYPSKIHLRHKFFFVNILKTALLMAVSIYVSLLNDGFIFGEYYKALPYKILFFWKRQINLSYYADIEQITTFPANDISKSCTLFYAGSLEQNYGFHSVLDCAKQIAQKYPNTNFTLCIYSKDEKECIINEPNLKILFHKFLPFLDFCTKFGEADLFFDLRKIDWENTRCLPIKIFYYMAAGRPVIYSDFKAIRKGLPEIEEFGSLVNPKNTSKIVEQISKYITNKDLYEQHCRRARELAENKYNWENIKKDFVDFIEK